MAVINRLPLQGQGLMSDEIKAHIAKAEKHFTDTSLHFGINATANKDGTLYRGNTAPTGTQKLNYSGYFEATRVYGSYYSDYAEMFNVVGDVLPGDVIEICGDNEYRICDTDCSPTVIGVVSDDYYLCIGRVEGVNNVPIALAGKVRVSVLGKCKPGDWLVSAGNGLARAVYEGEQPAFGAVIGQALESGDGKGRVLMLVARR